MIALLLFLLSTASASFSPQLDALKSEYEKIGIDKFIKKKIGNKNFDKEILSLSADEYSNKLPCGLVDLIIERRNFLSGSYQRDLIKSGLMATSKENSSLKKAKKACRTRRCLCKLRDEIHPLTSKLSGFYQNLTLNDAKDMILFLKNQESQLDGLAKKITEPIFKKIAEIENNLKNCENLKNITFREYFFSFLKNIAIVEVFIANTNLRYSDFSSEAMESIYELAVEINRLETILIADPKAFNYKLTAEAKILNPVLIIDKGAFCGIVLLVYKDAFSETILIIGRKDFCEEVKNKSLYYKIEKLLKCVKKKLKLENFNSDVLEKMFSKEFKNKEMGKLFLNLYEDFLTLQKNNRELDN